MESGLRTVRIWLARCQILARHSAGRNLRRAPIKSLSKKGLPTCSGLGTLCDTRKTCVFNRFAPDAKQAKGTLMHKAIFILLVSTMSALAGLSKLDAISMIESGNNDSAIGGAGEVSRYQIKPQVWRSFTNLNAYQNQKVSCWVAAQYLSVLESNFEKRAGRLPTDFDLYVLWNAGYKYYARIGFAARRVHPVIRERAERFVNLRQMPGELERSISGAPKVSSR